MKKLLFIFLALTTCTSKELHQEPLLPLALTNHTIPFSQHDTATDTMKNATSKIAEDSQTVEKPLPQDINYTPKGKYQQLKAKVKARQSYYQTKATDTVADSLVKQASQEITQLLLQELFPFWYGTEWDFNGYTAVPQQGEIACGYLVSTTLRDVGFRLNRYHLAQQAAYYAAISLQKKAKLKIYRDLSPEALKSKLVDQLKLKSGLYFVGLDNHVGYLLIHHQELYFIHSNYITDQVMIERVEESMAFGSSIYVIADITHNDTLIRKWIKGEVIPIKRA